MFEKNGRITVTTSLDITFLLVSLVVSSPIMIFMNPTFVIVSSASPTDPSNTIMQIAPSTITQEGREMKLLLPLLRQDFDSNG
jgi:hypothetical protein